MSINSTKLINYTTKNNIDIYSTLKKKDLEKKIKNNNLKLNSQSILLSGHKSEVFTCKFSPEGTLFATAGIDKLIYIWDVFSHSNKDKCITNLNCHTNCILDICWVENFKLVSGSVDKSINYWDVFKNSIIRKFKSHINIVNSLDVLRYNNTTNSNNNYYSNTMVSTGEDGKVLVWDLRCKEEQLKIQKNFQLTSVKISSNSNNSGETIYFGGIDNKIYAYDLRNNHEEYILNLHNNFHTDVIISLAVSNSGDYLISSSLDNRINLWNVKSYCSSDNSRYINTFNGINSNFEKNLIKASWSNDDKLIASGSSDRHVYIWNVLTGQNTHKLCGHNASVNEVNFCKIENIIGSVSSDSTAIIGYY